MELKNITDLKPGQKIKYREGPEVYTLTILESPDGETVNAITEEGIETFLMTTDIKDIIL